ncbi:MAG: hypothetical protein A3A86_01995 [Elusimicrobia bacterium RIFCSPLOWO2_01_FULL_60_11]|nr:MAG: hypothetical protein A3A86_01995 [Elusimicrobia bacterium RIFCSPLOWO2_01_FULL_60_11]
MILFVASRETDYLQDLTYAGLAEILGVEKVWDFPSHWQYHSEKRFFWNKKAEYPQNLGYTPSDQLCALSSFSEANLAVLASAKPDALQEFHKIFDELKCPWVFVDGGDRKEIGGDFKRTGGDASFRLFQELWRKRPPALVFKRELSLQSRDPLVLPFPFSFKSGDTLLNSAELSKVSPKYDVLFWAVESSETRALAFQVLKGKYDCEANGSVPGQKFRKYGLRGKEYFEALASAKIALSFRGEGFDTLRYWEIPACGSFMVSEPPIIQIPENFKDGKHAVFCKPDLSDLTDKIDHFLKNEKEREDIARAGREHLLKYHTHRARAEYFIGKVKEVLSLDLRR